MIPHVTYAALTEATAPALATSDVLDGPCDETWLAAFLADPQHLMELALNNGEVIGFASGTILLHPDKAPTLFINEVGVVAGHRRRGIATRLAERLISRSRDAGCASAWLATEEQNSAARALYRRLGARESGGIIVYDWDADL